jgi:hypothetical protein
MTLSIPARVSSRPSSRPEGPEPMMATWVRMAVLLSLGQFRQSALSSPAPPNALLPPSTGSTVPVT